MLSLGVIVGSRLIVMLPDSIRQSFTFLLPSLFGAVFAQFSVDDVKSGVCAMVLGVVTLLMYNQGLFNWVPVEETA